MKISAIKHEQELERREQERQQAQDQSMLRKNKQQHDRQDALLHQLQGAVQAVNLKTVNEEVKRELAWAKTQQMLLQMQNNDALKATREATANLLVHKLREANAPEKALAWPGAAFDAEALCNITDRRAKHLRDERLTTWRSAMDAQVAARSFAWAHDALMKQLQKTGTLKHLQDVAIEVGGASRTSAWLATTALATMDALSSAADANKQLSKAYCAVADTWVQQHGGTKFQEALDHAFAVEMLAQETLKHLESSQAASSSALPVEPSSQATIPSSVPNHKADAQHHKAEQRQLVKHSQTPKADAQHHKAEQRQLVKHSQDAQHHKPEQRQPVKHSQTLKVKQEQKQVHDQKVLAHKQPSQHVAKQHVSSKATMDAPKKHLPTASGKGPKCPNYPVHGSNICKGGSHANLEVNGKLQLRDAAALAIAAQKQALMHATKASKEGKTAAVAASKALRKAEHFRRIGGDFAKASKGHEGLAHVAVQKLQLAVGANAVAASSEEEISKLLKKSEYKAALAAKKGNECAKSQGALAALHQKAVGSFVAGSVQMAKICKAENLAMLSCQRSSDALCDLHVEAVKLREAVKLSNKMQKDAESATKAASAVKTLKALPKRQKTRVASAVVKTSLPSMTVLPVMHDDEDLGGYEEAILDATRVERALSGEGLDDETALMQI
jgi:hypothetical protein